jgi:transcriptional regulator with XRE-family HTH domain
MTAAMLSFGVLLRRWRQNRRLSQEALALAAGSSTRHLSCLETARSQPSREMILRLAEQLEIPLRDQNALLLAAGFAPAFQERSLAELENARQAIEQILEAHKPYPAFALDRHWNVVASNRALPQLYEMLARAAAQTDQRASAGAASRGHGTAHRQFHRVAGAHDHRAAPAD